MRLTTPKPIRDAYKENQAATCVLLCRNWLQDHPDDLPVILDYAGMLYKMARYEDAISVYQDALDRFPENRWGISNQLGHLHRYRGAMVEAEAAYRQAMDIHPEEAASYIFLGSVQARQGKLEEAENTHRLATKCSAGFIEEAFHNLGLVLRGQGRLAEAKLCFEKAIEIDGNYEAAKEALNDVTTAIAIEKGD